MLLRSAARRAVAPLARATLVAHGSSSAPSRSRNASMQMIPARSFFFGKGKKATSEGAPLTPSETVDALRAARDKANVHDDIPEDTGVIPERFLRDETILTDEQEALMKVRQQESAEADARMRRKLFILRTLVLVCGAIGLSLPVLLIYANKEKLGFQWDYFPLLMQQPPMVEATSQASFDAAFARACADVLSGVTPEPANTNAASTVAAAAVAAIVPAHSHPTSAAHDAPLRTPPPTDEVLALRAALSAGLPAPAPPTCTPLLSLLRPSLGEPYVGRDPVSPDRARFAVAAEAEGAGESENTAKKTESEGSSSGWWFWNYIPFYGGASVSSALDSSAVSVAANVDEEEYTLLSLHDAEAVARATLCRTAGAVHDSLPAVLVKMAEKHDLATTDADQSRTFLAQFTQVIESGEKHAVGSVAHVAEAQMFGYLKAGVAGLPAQLPLVSQAELRRALIAAEAGRAAAVKAAYDGATGVWGTPSEGQKAEMARRANVATMLDGAIKDLEKIAKAST